MPNLEERFHSAAAESKNLKQRPDNETLLEIYSYFKQATEGDVSGGKPGAIDFVARAKYEAWQARKGMSRDVAMKAYIKLIDHLKEND
ncbi:MAG: acyl-CoA-binding protein [Gammaproteobacteria bacterium]